MAIHLQEKTSQKIAENWTHESYAAGKASTAYDFDGVRDILITNIVPVPMTDYNRSGRSRYGETYEVQDEKQRLTMVGDYAFSASIDKGNKLEQGSALKQVGRFLNKQLKTVVVPESDKRVFKKWAHSAGHIVESASLAKNTVVEALFKANEWFIDHNIPFENTYAYVPTSVYGKIRLSPEFMGVESLAGKILTKGVVGQIADFMLTVVPSNYLPTGCQFLIANKNSVLFPKKLWGTKIHMDPPDISGNLIQGRFIYDGFVIGELSNGVYACIETGKKAKAPTITPSTGVIASDGNVIKYTDDGSDPRYSATAQVYGAALGDVTKKTIKAYAYKLDGSLYASDVVVSEATA